MLRDIFMFRRGLQIKNITLTITKINLYAYARALLLVA
jgi:hypothetical protein